MVSGVSFSVNKGECFALLGPNGAGKSTTMKMLYGSVQITSGELYMLGISLKKNVRDVKARIGVVPQEDGLDPEFTVYENLEIYSTYHGIDSQVAKVRIEEVLKITHLEEMAHRSVEQLSGGMKRRLAIARGLLNHPEILILDEPTVGLDPQARLWIWNFIQQLQSEGVTVIMSTHYMEEAQKLCNRVAIMDKGRILAMGTPGALVKELIGKEVIEVEMGPKEIIYFMNRMNSEGVSYQTARNQLNVHLKEGQSHEQFIQRFHGYQLTIRQPNLSDVFLKLSGHDLRDEPL